MKLSTNLISLLAIFGGVAMAFPNPAPGTEHLSTRGQPDPDKFGAELFREGGMYCREFCDAWPHNWRCQIPWPKTCFECNNVDLVHPCKKKSMWAGDFGHND